MIKSIEALERLSQIKIFFESKKRKEPNNPLNEKWEKNILIIEQALKKLKEIEFEQEERQTTLEEFLQ